MAGMEDRRAAVTSSSTVVSGGLGRGGFEPIVDDGEGVSLVGWWRLDGGRRWLRHRDVSARDGEEGASTGGGNGVRCVGENGAREVCWGSGGENGGRTTVGGCNGVVAGLARVAVESRLEREGGRETSG